MSRFYGSILGQAKTPATRRGSEKSGIESHTRGWNVGVKVAGWPVNGEDMFVITATSGSNGGVQRRLGVVRLIDGEPTFTPEGQ